VNTVHEKLSVFASDHIYLVAFLICAGHEVSNVVRNGRRVSFEFAQTPEVLGDVAAFMSGASVPARRFSFEVLKLKRMLHGGQYEMEKMKKNENKYVYERQSH
jgi:hypothetical protein